jgi:hypothetical protein
MLYCDEPVVLFQLDVTVLPPKKILPISVLS